MPTLTTISIYPVKSLRGYALERAYVERMGLENDRRLMVIEPDGMFVTQREHASMALIKPTIKDGMLSLSAAGRGDLNVPILSNGARKEVEIWDDKNVGSIDQGEKAAGWLSDFLNMPVRLVRIADDRKRLVSPDHNIRPDDHVGFADGYPILITSQESLDDLNSRLERPILMNRFRPNIVVSGTHPFAEDGWRRIRIGEVELALVKPCARCNVPDIDQETAEISKEPNKTLAKYRRINGKIMFGVNVIPITSGEIRAGDNVEILE